MAWFAGLVVLQALLWARGARDLAREASAGLEPSAAAFALARTPWRMSPRELRVLPGIGERLALAIADARRAALAVGARPRWEDVRGIGPRTAARVRAWLQARRLPTELCGGDARAP